MVLRKSKLKVSLRLRENLWSHPLTRYYKKKWSPLKRRGLGLYYPQLVHKATHLLARRWTYANRLRSKQKLRVFYGNISEKAFRNLYKKSRLHDNFLGLLESRLDSSLYRAHFVATPFQGRQAISHGHLLVNGKVVKRKGYSLRSGDLVEVKEKHLLSIQKSMKSRLKKKTAPFKRKGGKKKRAVRLILPPLPKYLEVQHSICALIFLSEPQPHEVFFGMPIHMQSLAEFYG
jgi:small subunit ribosomal protein S4